MRSWLTSIMGNPGLSQRGDDGKLPEFGNIPSCPNVYNITIPKIIRVAIMISIICFLTILCIAILHEYPDHIASFFFILIILAITPIIIVRGISWIRSESNDLSQKN